MPPSVRRSVNVRQLSSSAPITKPVIRSSSMKGFKQFGLDAIQENECITATDRRPPRGLRLVRSESVPISKFASLFMTQESETFHNNKRQTWGGMNNTPQRWDPDRLIASDKPILLLGEQHASSAVTNGLNLPQGKEELDTRNIRDKPEDVSSDGESSVSDSSSDDEVDFPSDDIHASDDSRPEIDDDIMSEFGVQNSPLMDVKPRARSPSFRSRMAKGFRGVFSIHSTKSGCTTFRAKRERRSRPRSGPVVL